MQFSQVFDELAESDQRLGKQLTLLQGQLETVRCENREAALRLSDEQRRTKRLHDPLPAR